MEVPAVLSLHDILKDSERVNLPAISIRKQQKGGKQESAEENTGENGRGGVHLYIMWMSQGSQEDSG